MLRKINQRSIHFLMWFMSHFKLQANLRSKKKKKGTHGCISDQQGRVLWRQRSAVKCMHPGSISNFLGWMR